jgi:hypothetical protein
MLDVNTWSASSTGARLHRTDRDVRRVEMSGHPVFGMRVLDAAQHQVVFRERLQ